MQSASYSPGRTGGGVRPARTIMVQGTASSVGKSLLTAALCRILTEDGLRVSPFKSQNMSNNSYVTPDGREIGRAQALQAAACGTEPSSDMNPVLLKPEADSRCQVVVDGRSTGSMPAREYYRRRATLWPHVTAALGRLRDECDVVLIEGAGSPAEVNLRAGDISNMAVALHAASPVLLVGDIDRGGVFASLLGTLELLAVEERALVKGLVINRFRGDRTLLEPLPTMIAERTNVPVIGVVPYIADVQLAEEDSVSLGDNSRPLSLTLARKGREDLAPVLRGRLKVAAVRLPHVSNFGDLDPLARAGADVGWADTSEHLRGAHLIVIPGAKTTIADLRWLKERAMDRAVRDAVKAGAAVVGICGGYQMLCKSLNDPHAADSGQPTAEEGLGLLNGETVFEREKSTVRVQFEVNSDRGMFAGKGPVHGEGYEIHTGRTVTAGHTAALTVRRGGPGPTNDAVPEGAVDEGGWVLGTYVHGLFDSPDLLRRLLGNIARRHGLPAPVVPDYSLDAEIARVAAVVRAAIDMKSIYAMLGLPGRG